MYNGLSPNKVTSTLVNAGPPFVPDCIMGTFSGYCWAPDRNCQGTHGLAHMTVGYMGSPAGRSGDATPALLRASTKLVRTLKRTQMLYPMDGKWMTILLTPPWRGRKTGQANNDFLFLRELVGHHDNCWSSTSLLASNSYMKFKPPESARVLVRTSHYIRV